MRVRLCLQWIPSDRLSFVNHIHISRTLFRAANLKHTLYTHSYLLVILIISYTFSRRGTHFCVYKTKYGSTFFLTSLPFLRIFRGGAGVVRGSTKSLYPQLLYPAFEPPAPRKCIWRLSYLDFHYSKE